MSVLSSTDINREQALSASSYSEGMIDIERIEGGDVSVQPSSVDMHLGREFASVSPTENLVDVRDRSTYPTYSYTRTDEYTIPGRSVALAHTDEYIELSEDVVGFLWGRSSVGRLFLFIHTAGLCDPGFKGQVTLELVNAAPYPIRVHEGMRICQMTLHELETSSQMDYGGKDDSKYQDQLGVTPSQLYEDFDGSVNRGRELDQGCR